MIPFKLRYAFSIRKYLIGISNQESLSGCSDQIRPKLKNYADPDICFWFVCVFTLTLSAKNTRTMQHQYRFESKFINGIFNYPIWLLIQCFACNCNNKIGGKLPLFLWSIILICFLLCYDQLHGSSPNWCYDVYVNLKLFHQYTHNRRCKHESLIVEFELILHRNSKSQAQSF